MTTDLRVNALCTCKWKHQTVIKSFEEQDNEVGMNCYTIEKFHVYLKG